MSKRLLTIMMVLALALTAPFAAAQETKAPRVTLVEPMKDFGTVPRGEKLEFAFQVKNTGTNDLEILAARPTCGCTVAEFDKIIKPGQTGKVMAVVDTTTFAGPISKSVTLETNDPNTPTAQLTISAIVKPYVEAYPAGFVRYNMIKGNVEKQSVTLYSEEEEPFEILKVESPQDWIKIQAYKLEGPAAVPNVGRPGQAQYRLEFTVGGPDASVGPLAEKVRIVTNSKHQPEYMVSIAGVIRPPYRIEPTGVNFGEVSPNDPAAVRSIVLRSNDLKAPDAFVVTKAESSLPGITTAIKPTGNKGEYEVTLQVQKDAKPGELDGSVTIHTTDTGNPTVRVPVRGTIVKATASAAPAPSSR